MQQNTPLAATLLPVYAHVQFVVCPPQGQGRIKMCVEEGPCADVHHHFLGVAEVARTVK